MHRAVRSGDDERPLVEPGRCDPVIELPARHRLVAALIDKGDPAVPIVDTPCRDDQPQVRSDRLLSIPAASTSAVAYEWRDARSAPSVPGRRTLPTAHRASRRRRTPSRRWPSIVMQAEPAAGWAPSNPWTLCRSCERCENLGCVGHARTQRSRFLASQKPSPRADGHPAAGLRFGDRQVNRDVVVSSIRNGADPSFRAATPNSPD
jgi:hypothetical protein